MARTELESRAIRACSRRLVGRVTDANPSCRMRTWSFSTRRPAQATFEAEIDGVATDLPWNDGHEPPEPLSDIAIFDSHCARAYIDNQGDFAYSPYGLDILEGLVGACNRLKARALAEKTANAPNNAAYGPLASKREARANELDSPFAHTTKRSTPLM